MSDPAIEVVLTLTDHVFRRYILPAALIAAAVLRYNVYSLIYLILFLVGVIIAGPRQRSNRIWCVLYLVIVLTLSIVFAVSQLLFQITLATGPELVSCDTLEVILRQIGLIQYTESVIEVVRYLSLDLLVAMIAAVSVGMSAKVATLHNRPDSDSLDSSNEPVDSDHPVPSELTNLSTPPTNNYASTCLPQSYLRLPQWLLVVLDILIFFLFWLSGVAVPSIVSFWYFAVFFVMCWAWSIHFSHTQSLGRVLRIISLVYSAVHILLLYLYQFQSFQLVAPSTAYENIDDLMVRLFGLTPIIETSCLYGVTRLLVWDETPVSYFVNPWALLGLYWLLGTDCQLWLATPKPYWTFYQTYFIPKIATPHDVYKIQRKGRSSVQHYGATSDTIVPKDEAETEVKDATTEVEESNDFSELNASLHSKTYVNFLAIKQKLVYQIIELWNRLMSVSYVFSLVAMMVWSVLFPSWPALVLLLWAVAIWVIPRVNPKQSLQYSSPFLVVYASALLILSYINSLPVTMDAFTWGYKVGIECKYTSTNIEDCLSTALGEKCLLSLVFFASLRQLIKEIKDRKRGNRQGDTQMTQLLRTNQQDEDESTPSTVSKLYAEVYLALTTYWIVVVLGAFLLVVLVGQPSVLKTVYLVFLYVFFLIYQLFRKWWLYLSYPIWWILVLYAALHLVIVYTFQFQEIRDLWYNGFDKYNVSDDFTAMQVFRSVGFESSDLDNSRGLFNLLVPLAVFIAVIALQVRYFTLHKMPQHIASQITQDRITVAQILSGLTRAVTLTDLPLGEIERDIVKKEQELERRRERAKSSSDEMDLADDDLLDDGTPIDKGWEVTGSRETTPTDSTSVTFYRIVIYSLIKLRQFIIMFWHLMWRFFEIHTSKLIVIALFAFGLYELSATYFIAIVITVIIAPLPFLNPLMYPIITAYLGVLAVAKYIYQFPVISVYNIDKSCNNTISDLSDSIPGKVFSYMFSPQSSDTSWLGLNQTNDPATYVGGVIAVALLICFWYASKRHQMFHYSRNEITIAEWEYRSLFLGIDYTQVNHSAIDGLKFLVNHWFDMYGIEVCLVFEAVLVAARIDIYGILYVVILGLMLIAPRSLMAPVWLIFLVLHGMAILVQYVFLVGLPPSGICHFEGYPWDSVFAIGNNSFGSMERWLYLPHVGNDTLNKYLLYVDLFAYLLICVQMRTFISNSLTILKKQNMLLPPPDIYKTRYWFDSLKVLVFQYSFWVALFILFATAATRLSLIGLVYLLLCCVFFYRGQDLLTDPRRIRIRWWSVLRMFVWSILLLRIILQFVGCVFGDHGIFDDPDQEICLLVSVFNIRCVRDSYYGVKDVNTCDNGSETSTGLWLDVVSFASLTLMIIILDTSYAEQVRNKVIRKEEDAQRFAAVKKQLTEEKKAAAKKKEEDELIELKDRAQSLKLTEGKVDHFLYAGVRVPPNYLTSVKNDIPIDESAAVPTIKDQPLEDVSEEDDEEKEVREKGQGTKIAKDRSEDSSDTASQLEVEISFVKKALMFIQTLWLSVIDYIIEWLERNSDDYRLVVLRVKRARYQSGRDVLLETVPPLEGVASIPPTLIRTKTRTTDEPEVKSKVGGASPGGHGLSPKPGSSHFDESDDTLIKVLQPSESEEQEARKIQSRLQDFTKRHSERPRRLFTALYYWAFSHFEYVVFFFVIIAIITTGTLPSFIYAGLLFLWGLLSLPMPSKSFWLVLIFYTMLVMIIKYIYSFFLFSWLQQKGTDFTTSRDFLGHTVIGWMFGVNIKDTYFINAVTNLLLLMVLLFQRGLLKQFGLWTNVTVVKSTSSNLFKRVIKTLKQYFKQVLESSSVAGRKDYYIGLLTFDVLCFITIVFGYSSFSVTATTGTDLSQVAEYIQSNNIPLPFLIMLMLQFLSMLVDRAIYVRHSVMAKLVFYLILLVGWHVWLLIVVPILTHTAFTDNPAAQIIYFFKSGYFILSALQIISGYPTRLLTYFVGQSYSTVSGLLFTVYRLIPIIPELREVIDWMFTDTSLSLVHWLTVQELYAQLYQVKVRRMREKFYSRDLGEKQSLISKILLGGGFVIALVLLIWGPLIVISFVNQASQPNPPLSASISLSLEGSQLLEINAQNVFVFDLSPKQYGELRGKVQQQSVQIYSEFETLFRKENFRHILFPGDSSLIWTASPTTKQQLKSILDPDKISVLEFSWSLVRSVSGIGDETVTGSYRKNITGDTISKFIQDLDTDLSNHGSNIPLDELYPILIYSPTTGASTEFKRLSQYIPNSSFNCTASLSTNDAYTLKSPNNTLENNTQQTIITEWWTLSPNKSSKPFLKPSEQEKDIPNALEMVVYSQPVSPPFLSFVVSFGVIGLYLSVVLVIGRFIRGYVSSLPQNLLIDQIAFPDPLLKLCDDIFFVREMKNLVLEEILVGKLYYIFRSPDRLISLTEKEKTD